MMYNNEKNMRYGLWAYMKICSIYAKKMNLFNNYKGQFCLTCHEHPAHQKSEANMHGQGKEGKP